MSWLIHSELDEETLKADLAVSLSVEPDGITVKETDDDGGTFDTEGGEYRFFWDEEKAEEAARSQVRSDLEESPEMFNQDWLQNHITISDTDKRMIASEEADNLVDEVLGAEELVEKAGMTDEYAEAADDESKQESIVEAAKEKVRDEESDRIESELADPIQYFVHDQGIYSVEDLLKANFIQTDIDGAAEDALSTDGWPHFISHYDGTYDTTAKGIVYFREN